jgi:hypothetical protein
MPTSKSLKVEDLSLDLRNFRTPQQKSELAAVKALIAANPDWFWALTESLMEEGYHLTENIVVYLPAGPGGDHVVKEGNRRIAALKLCLGQVRRQGLTIPADVIEKIDALTDEWKATNAYVPCLVFGKSELKAVDKIVTLTHGKNERAGRDKWKAVARARHNRDMNNESEPALDLLESYLVHGQNLTGLQKERWGADYPLSVLDEAMKKLAPRLSVGTTRDLATLYPKKVPHRSKIENILLDIGLEQLGFTQLRDKQVDHLAAMYGIPSGLSSTTTSATATGSPATTTNASTGATASTGAATASTGSTGATGVATAKTGSTTAKSAAKTTTPKTTAYATDDPRSVLAALKGFIPVGKNREKLVTLLNEARTLRLERHPHAFCFLLRSMFEVSAKAYCKDHAASGLQATKNGVDRQLVEILRDITKNMTNNNADKQKVKALHGATAELAKHDGFLSVTSMNQLVHNPSFSVKETHISTLFGNVFPLLEAMSS